MEVIHYGLFDAFGEEEWTGLTAHSSTAYGIIKEELLFELSTMITQAEDNIEFDYAKKDLERFTGIKTTIDNSTCLLDFESNGNILYEVWPLTGTFDNDNQSSI